MSRVMNASLRRLRIGLSRHAAQAGLARSSSARRNAARNPDSNFHLSSILRLTSLASSLYKINQRLEALLFERPVHTLHHTIARTRSPFWLGIDTRNQNTKSLLRSN